MKQFLLSSLVLCGLLLGAGSCSSNEGEVMGPPLTDVNAAYQDETLELMYGEGALAGADKKITFYSEDKLTAKISLQNVIPGVDNLELSDVLLTSSKDETQFLFKGASDKDNCQLDYSGYVEKGKLVINLKVNVATNSAVAGRWTLQQLIPGDDEGEPNKKQSVIFNWDSDYQYAIPSLSLKLPTSTAASNLSAYLSENVMKNLLSTLTLSSDGGCVFTYANEVNDLDPSWTDTPVNAIQYYLKGDYCYLLLNKDLLNRSNALTSRAVISWIDIILQMYPDGIPFRYSIADGGKLSLWYEDRETINTFSNVVFPLLANYIPDPDSTNQMIVFLMENILDVKKFKKAMETTTKFELGLNFSLVKQGV